MNLLEVVPPHSIEAEQGVLGGLMLDNQTWDLLADVLVPEDFYRREHRLIFQSIQTLASSNASEINARSHDVQEAFEQKLFALGWGDYPARLSTSTTR
ncbi:DnaB-like helicase N-terminal domain-containing protein [Pseudomonas cichorii]|uniref:DnaB-like helicase N-terminal domain-containing protein n=1 Tax=Pseudomonas cichorii TaxID=36746 RepID=UPI001C88E349|nr:hypothetical protein [Pseudomonas cichorii]MBX8528748.1 hypothetical protein [Pseudomonas cichorii]